MSSDDIAWRQYEEHIFAKLSEWAGADGRVEANQHRTGRFSGVPRQIDILVTGRFAGITEREATAAVDCKYYTRNIDVKKVDEFVGYFQDVGTDFGLLITNRGFSAGALQRAAVPSIEARVIVANVDQIPAPPGDTDFGDAYYESEYFTIDGGGKAYHGAAIRYSYINPAADEYSLDPEHPWERFYDDVWSGPESEISWGDDQGRAKCARLILTHRNRGVPPSEEDVERFVSELAQSWTDGSEWMLRASDLRSQLGL